jgi:dolichol-phosphate mannosyltransferase
MNDSVTTQPRTALLLNTLLRYRFIKFGCVGLLGTAVNLVMLYAGQEYLYSAIADSQDRLHLSLATAIAVATLHNYLWNRIWTWAERRQRTLGGFFIQLFKYYLSCTLAIAAQYLLTIVLAYWVHYMIANIASIAVAAVLTYLVNDVWTFARGKVGTEG